ncbi:MAG: hypothetical protein WCC04_05740 [Terriglobales bacterium]
MRNIRATTARPSQVGKRLGKLQIMKYLGRDQDSGQDVFECRCLCGLLHQLDMQQIQNDRNWSCAGCNPAAKEAISAKAEFHAEKREQAQKTAAELAEKQRQAAVQQEVAHRKRVREFFGADPADILAGRA